MHPIFPAKCLPLYPDWRKKGSVKACAVLGFICLGFCACTSISEKQASIILLGVAEKAEREEDLTGDLLIMNARDYYVHKKKIAQAASAWYYCGRVYLQRKEYDPALNAFKEAETLANKTKNYELLTSIYYYMGIMYQEMLLNTNALEKLHLALQNIRENSFIFDKEFDVYDAMASSYIINSQSDSALFYYSEALQCALKQQDITKQFLVIRHIGVSYLQEEMVDSARIYLTKSIKMHKEIDATDYFLLAGLSYKEQSRDSAMFYANQALDLTKRENNNGIQRNVYKLLYEMERSCGNYDQALEYQDLYTQYLAKTLTEKKEQDILISERKYNYEQTQNKNKQLLIERQYILLVISALTIIAVSVSFYFVWRFSKQKAHALELEKASLEAEQRIHALQNMAAGFNTKEQSLRMEALSRFDIVKKVALLKEDQQFNAKTSAYKRSPMERINEIIYGSINGFKWNVFFDSIRNNVLYEKLFDSIDQKDFFRELDETSQRVCYLTCMDFSNSEIATILDCSLRTVEQKKTNLRKNLELPTKEDVKKYLI